MVGKAKNSYEQSCNLRKSLSHLNFVLVTLRIWDFMEDMKFISGVKGARSLSQRRIRDLLIAP